ncbi:MAG: FAD-dependent oxidoreductase, partial [Actinobacteria bacterium]|nr:FAD-dependent oxidoreductase [Actinomycetota bacterium]
MNQYDVLIVGGGFGGAFAARRLEQLLRGRGERVLLVAGENFFLFSPLLPEAASGTLEPRHAVIPLREFLPRTAVLTGRVTALDPAARRATIVDLNGDTHEVAFRSLILSPGSVPTTLPIPGLLENAVGFKTLPDAIWLRNRVLRQLDAADATDDLALRRELLTFTFIGGGYSGVEALAELESLTRDALRRAYPRLRPNDLRWVLVEAAPTLLPGLDPRLASYAERALRRKAVELHLSTRLESCVDGIVHLSDNAVAPYTSATIVWTAGQRPSELPRRIGLPVDDRGRVPVDSYLRVPG